MKLLEDEGELIRTEGGVVVLDLGPIITELGEQVPAIASAVEDLPESAGRIEILESDQLDTAQTITSILKVLANWLWIVALLLAALAIWLARGRRRSRCARLRRARRRRAAHAAPPSLWRELPRRRTDDRRNRARRLERVADRDPGAGRPRVDRDRPRRARPRRSVVDRAEPARRTHTQPRRARSGKSLVSYGIVAGSSPSWPRCCRSSNADSGGFSSSSCYSSRGSRFFGASSWPRAGPPPIPDSLRPRG